MTLSNHEASSAATNIEAQVRLYCQFRFLQASWTYLQTDPSNDWVAYELLKCPGEKKTKLVGNYMRTSCSLGSPNCAVRQYTTPDPIQMIVVSDNATTQKQTHELFKACFVFRRGGHTKRISYPYIIQYFILFMNPTLQTFLSSLILRSSSQLVRSQSSRPTPWPVPGFLVKPVKLEMADRLEPRVLGKMAPGTAKSEKP